MTTSAKPLGQLEASDAVLFVCDVQEKFRSAIHGYEAVVDASARLVKAAPTLSVPIVVTEQYPARLGPTVHEISEHLPEGSVVVAKTRFSMLVPEVAEALEKLGRKTALIVGIESHVCVLQTTLDLLSQGYEVHLITDAISSRSVQDRAAAFRRLESVGAHLATSEMVLFQLMKDTSHPGFKPVSALIKESRPEQLPPV